MENLAEAFEVLGTGILVVFAVMALLSLSIWVMGRGFVFADKHKKRKLAAQSSKGGDK